MHYALGCSWQNGRSRLVCGWMALSFCVACQSQRPAQREPEWPKEAAPEYPGMSASDTDAGPGDQAPLSQSPLAVHYQGHPAVQKLVGSATYYADSLAGNKTASGEVYRPAGFTAAHKTLPFGTVLRVVRSDTARQTYVTVNDRGPFAGSDRIIDLSRAAASELEMLKAGVVPVTVEVLELPGSGEQR